MSDPDINRLDQAYGEPFVTVNGKRLRMAQATDGNWYAYLADSKQAQIADSTAPKDGKGLNFGNFCAATSGTAAVGVDLSETKGFAIGSSDASGNSNGTSNPSATVAHVCTGATGGTTEHVVRENKTLNSNAPGSKLGQISSNNAKFDSAWPVIQLYDFASLPTSVTIDYHKAGGDQITNLTFDRIPQQYIAPGMDRSSYPPNTQVLLTIQDPQLNIDPTEEDSWTWGVNANNNTLIYQLFDRNGAADADGTLGAQNLIPTLSALMFNHNGKLTANPAAQGVMVLDFQSNGKQLLNGSLSTRGNPLTVHTQSLAPGSAPLTFIETGGVNTGILGNWDGAKKSDLVTVDSPAIRGQSATIRYNDVQASIVGGFNFGSIAMTAVNATWASGQRIPVTLTDNDVNLNTKTTEHLNAYDPNVKRIATMVIGNPFSIGKPTAGAENAALIGKVTTVPTATSGVVNFTASGQNATSVNSAQDESFSFRPTFIFTNQTAGNAKSDRSHVVL